MVTINRKSPFTGKLYTMVLPMEIEEYEAAYEQWQAGTLIQNAFPMLDADQREFVKTGIPPVEWAEFIGEDA